MPLHELTTIQRDALRTLRWLHDPSGQRATGRTYILALAYIDRAVMECLRGPWQRELPGFIEVHDHHPTAGADHELFRTILQLLSETRCQFDYQDNRFRFRIRVVSHEMVSYLDREAADTSDLLRQTALDIYNRGLPTRQTSIHQQISIDVARFAQQRPPGSESSFDQGLEAHSRIEEALRNSGISQAAREVQEALGINDSPLQVPGVRVNVDTAQADPPLVAEESTTTRWDRIGA